jgi:formylglycine-generating enzyme required for sulfatase activity
MKKHRAIILLLLVGLLLLFFMVKLFKFHGGKNDFPLDEQNKTSGQNEVVAHTVPNKPAASDQIGYALGSSTNTITIAPNLGDTNADRTDSASDSQTNVVDSKLESTNKVAPIQSELIWIPPGTFTMGSPDNEQDRRTNEGPQTVVLISRGFWLGKYEVTLAQYQSVASKVPFWSPYTGDPDNSPACVSWELATNYCRLLTEQERTAGRLPQGYIYRLPTEAEWEYACRAGTTTRFSFEEDPEGNSLGSNAWYSANSFGRTHTVGTKTPNPWGIYDMHGNVFEWCLDGYGGYPGGNVTDPIGVGKYHITRGGAWDTDGRVCRSAYRGVVTSGRRIINVGFRVALASELP